MITISNGFANFERFRARAVYCLNDHTFYSLTQCLRSNKRQGSPRGKYNKKKDVVLESDPNNNVDSMSDDPAD